MLHMLMDINPLDILSISEVAEKGTPSDVKTSVPAHTINSGQAETSESVDSEDTDGGDDSKEEMGKTTSNSLKRSHCAKDKVISVAPQKIWSSETMTPSHMVGIACKSDELMKDVEKKRLELKIIDKSVHESLCDIVMSSYEIKHEHNSDLVLSKNGISSLSVIKSELQSLDLLTEYEIKKRGHTLGRELSYQPCAKLNSNPAEDTVDVSDIKLQNKKETSVEFLLEVFVLDHPYALSPGQTRLSTLEDEDVDIGCDNCPMSGETDQCCSNLSMDYTYLKFRINEGDSASSLDFNKKFICSSKSLSPSSSTSSLTADMASRSSLSVFSGDENGDIFTGISSPDPASSNVTLGHFARKPVSKRRKLRIGPFAPLNSGNLQLEKFLKCKDYINSKRLNIGIPTDRSLTSSTLSSPSAFSNVYPLLQSPSLDWDRSEADSETQDDSYDARTPLRMSPDFTDKMIEWSHPVFHDHDYCAKDTESIMSADDFGKFVSFNGSADFKKCRSGKRKYTKKNKLNGLNNKKILKAKYLKKELLRKDTVLKADSELEHDSIDPTVMKANPVGRPRRRLVDKIVEEIDPETGTKLKITGKFKDQYVYYLSKSSRTSTRGRQTSAPVLTSDKIIVPAPNPGDIVIPHLTDADIEAVRLKGRDALNLAERPFLMSVSSYPQPAQSITPSSSQSNESISDVDSHIVSTILSMEDDSLDSQTTAQVPDIISAEGLNPDQPALTESLRLMSGDPSITSEHVLNYLLSMVKDYGFDTGSSVLFPSLSSDTTNNADHTGEPENIVWEDDSSVSTIKSRSLCSGQDLLSSTRPVQSISSFDSQTLLSPSAIHGHDKYVHTHKNSVDESIRLLDDLSSLMSESKSTLLSNVTPDGESHSSRKSMFKSDLNSLEPQQLSSSFHRLTSIGKTLDYLGTEDIKLESSVFDSRNDHDGDSYQALTPVSNTFADDDTPWIVTVTLYFNDVPAIMINNQPHIRLVDIHKQILPAKDTGILKKRCQLLKIPVLNCTEMQRYFLVQYGRAYNSKSTLIVSKENATDLIAYYANPQPRMGRVTETHQCRSGRLQKVGLPVSQPPSGNKKRHGGRGSKRALGSLSLSVSEGLKESHALLPQKDTAQKCEILSTSHGKRTNRNKINYLDMLKGTEKSSDANVSETIESVVKSVPDKKHNENSVKMHVKKKLKGTLLCNNKHGVMSRKLQSVHQKKKTEMSKIVQKVKISNAKQANKERSGQTVDLCSEADSGGSVDLSQSNKCKPLKLKVNSLLAGQGKGSSPVKKGQFSSSYSIISATTDRPVRILPVAHQAAISENGAESYLPSQPADIYLDLFIKPNSACVRCATCSQFLSVPHFMRHHHVPINSEWLATEAAQRILVPQNKNISQQGQQLWADFHRLQEAIGGFGEADDETDSDEDGSNDDQCSLDLSGCVDDADQASLGLPEKSHTSLLNVYRSSPFMKGQTSSLLSSTCYDSCSPMEDDENHDSIELGKKPFPVSASSSESQTPSSKVLAKTGLMWQDVDNSDMSDTGMLNTVVDLNTPITRTSTRKRKSKQLFSIENYYTPKRWAIGEEFNLQKPVRT